MCGESRHQDLDSVASHQFFLSRDDEDARPDLDRPDSTAQSYTPSLSYHHVSRVTCHVSALSQCHCTVYKYFL